MKHHRLAAAVALVGLVLAGCDKQAVEKEQELKTPAQKASYGIGLNMGRSLAQEGMNDLDSKAVALGIEDALAKKDQRLTDDQLMEAFGFLQKRAEERMTALADENAKSGKKFLDLGLQTAAGVPLQCDEPADFKTFRIGLFGLEKLRNIDRAVANLESALDKIAPVVPAPSLGHVTAH